MPDPTFPLQLGSQKGLQINAPEFSTVVVQDGTWKESDATERKAYKNGKSQSYLSAYADPGKDISCDWIVNFGQPLYVKGQVIQPTTDTTTSPRKFEIVSVDDSEFGGFVCKQSVKLEYRVAKQASLTVG